jgi:hypothetical protein
MRPSHDHADGVAAFGALARPRAHVLDTDLKSSVRRCGRSPIESRIRAHRVARQQPVDEP